MGFRQARQEPFAHALLLRDGMRFLTPEDAPAYDGSGWSMSVYHNCDLGAPEYANLRAELPDHAGEDGDFHASIFRPVTFLGVAGQLECVVGIHPREPGTAWAHWHLRVDVDRRPKEVESANSEQILRALASAIGPISARVSLYWRHNLTNAVPVVDLPITTADVVGFSEIRGVRLAQLDKATGEELFSMILDYHGEGELTASVAGEFETELDERVLLRGVERAFEIAELGLEEIQHPGES